ncbi:hypothetical protein PIROE2DRAFT_59499 [Piromyces sp. E2]|nr:hypothetical protein PIROE2DRAFT_59499 [Piromyces sp. E2]|eukprot:OUM66235.1 hypothetical protein PIROE2DRAFT_59499 [Piromyces sp. E2]
MLTFNKKLSIIIISIITTIIVIVGIILGITLSSSNTNEDTPKEGSIDDNNLHSDNKDDISYFNYKYPTQSHVGMASEYLGTTPRNLPKAMSNGGLERYPKYGKQPDFSDLNSDQIKDIKTSIIKENNALVSTGTSNLNGSYDNYDHMDENGIFYKNNEVLKDSNGNPIKLYKHTASEGMYNGDISPEEPAIIKKIKINPRGYGNHITGLYAPPGEIIKVEISELDLSQIGSTSIFIGQVLSSGKANNIWLEREFVRMPTIANKFPLDRKTIYIGYHLGGPIYIGTPENKKSFSVTISGAVPYPHFIQGYTTEEEWEFNLNSTAPYFDLEIWDDSIRFSGSRKAAGEWTYDELYDCAVLWDKITRISNSIPQYGNVNTGIVMLYEPFVAAGAAVAFQGGNTVNAPESWMKEVLDVQNFILNGSWGNIHELNHHYQRYGLPNGTEVTNNAVSLISYSLFTLISSSRTIKNDYTINNWNRFTDPLYVLKRLLSNVDNEYSGIYSLAAYATILHSFGQKKYIETANACNGNTGIEIYYQALTNSIHYDFTYYFEKILGLSISSDIKISMTSNNYPIFIPVSSVFQVGRNYFYDGEEIFIRTVQPFEISFDSPYTFNVLSDETFSYPSGFTVSIKAITSPINGKLESNDNNNNEYTYIPDKNKEKSGEFKVTLKIVKDDDSSIKINDITLLLEFKAKRKTMPKRTTYYYHDTQKIYKHVSDAIELKYTGYTSVIDYELSTPALWYDGEGIELNCVTEYNAKFFVTTTNTYRLALRGKQSNLSISRNGGQQFESIITIGDSFINHYPESIEKKYYYDINLKKGEVVYLKVVLLSADTTHCFFEIGCSIQKDDNTYEIPTIITNTFQLYSPDYEKPIYNPDYFISREYTGSEIVSPLNQKLISGENIESWDDTLKIDNLFDDKSSTYFHSKKNNYVSESNPFTITVDLGEIYTINSVILKGRPANVNQSPKFFKFYGGVDLENLVLIYSTDDKGSSLTNGVDIEFSFNTTQIHYYKLSITGSYNQYVALNGIYPSITGNEHSPDSLTYIGNWTVHSTFSPYGHVYTSTDSNSMIQFTFKGSYIMIYTIAGESQSFSISIDNENYEEVSISSTFEGYSYKSKLLNNDEHEIIIKINTRCTVASIITL